MDGTNRSVNSPGRTDQFDPRPKERVTHAIGNTALLEFRELTELQQSRITNGMRHPFFWSGIELIGTPW